MGKRVNIFRCEGLLDFRIGFFFWLIKVFAEDKKVFSYRLRKWFFY